MDNSILIRMRVPLSPERAFLNPREAVFGIPFNAWLPRDEDDFIIVSEREITLKIWFEQDSLVPGLPVFLYEILVDVTVANVPEEVIRFILEGKFFRSSGSESAELLRDLSGKVFSVTVEYFNRLISFVRTHKGQYWLQEYATDMSLAPRFFRACKAKVKTESSEWTEWNIPSGAMKPDAEVEANRFINKEDWREIKKSVMSSTRPSLIKELLAQAELLAQVGQQRSALVESIGALEVAIAEFARKHKADSELAKRIRLESLPSLVDGKPGLRGTIKFIFPAIFTEKQMPTELLRTCQDAVDQRGNVVHRGQRCVKQEDIHRFLRAIRDMCHILETFQQGSD